MNQSISLLSGAGGNSFSSSKAMERTKRKPMMPKMKFFIGVALYVLGGIVSTGNAAERWASTTGSGSTCSEALPCTAAEAKSQLAASDVLIFKNGTYNINFNNAIPSGTAAAPTTLTCENFRQCIIDPASGHAIEMSSARSNIRIAGIKFEMDTARCFRTHDGTVVTNLVFEDNECVGSATLTNHGLYIGTATTQSVFRRNYLHDLVSHGFYAAGSGNLYEYNVIVDVQGGSNDAFCVQFFTATGTSNNNIFRYNYCNPGGSGIVAKSLGITNGSGSGNVIHGNVVVNAVTAIRASRNVKIWNNSIYNVTTTFTYGTSSGCEIRNNLMPGESLPTNAGCTTTNNVTAGTPADIFSNIGGNNFCLKPGTSGIVNAGLNVGLPFNGSAPDIGACETVPITVAATATDSSVDIVFSMNLGVPLLPASGITGFTLSDTRTVTSVTRLSDSVVRLPYTGTCTGGTFSYAPGNATTAILVGSAGGSMAQPFFAITDHAIPDSCGGGTPPPPAGLHIHYKFDEGTGTNANDETANNLDGTLSASTLWVAGRTGAGAVEFIDGVADNVAVPYGSGVNPTTQDLVIAFDFQPTTSGTGEIYFGSAIGTNQRAHIAKRANNTMSIGIQASAAADNTEFPVVVGTWYRACLVFNATGAGEGASDTATLHINGVAGTTAQSVKAYTTYTLASNFDIGRYNGSTNDGIPGVISDNFKLWTAIEPNHCAEDYASEFPPAPPSGATLTQSAYRWYLLRTDPAGAAIKLPSSSSAINTPIGVPAGAVLAVEIQTDATVANPDAFSKILQYDVALDEVWVDVGDNCNVGKACFYGTSDSNQSILSGAPPAALTGALTYVAGGTQRTSAATPSTDLAQDGSTVDRYLIKIIEGPLRFRVIDQNRNPYSSYGPYPTVTVVGNYAGSM